MKSQSYATEAVAKLDENNTLRRVEPTLMGKLAYATTIHTLTSILGLPQWYKGWKEYFYPPEGKPDIVKYYETRRWLPVRSVQPSRTRRSLLVERDKAKNCRRQGANWKQNLLP